METRSRDIALLPPSAPGDALHLATSTQPTLLTPRAAPVITQIAPAPPERSPVVLDDLAAVEQLLAAAPVATPAQPVIIDPEKAAPASIASFHAGIIAGCLERVAMLARHRDERPLPARPRIEQRLLAQLDALAEAGTGPQDLFTHWAEEGEEDPWVTWAVVFSLASFDGGESLSAIADLVEELPAGDPARAWLAAEALLVAPHPHLAVLERDLSRSEAPTARAVAIEVRSRRGTLDPQIALEALDRGAPLVVLAALRALARTEQPALPHALRAALHHEDARVVREAARAITVLGHRDAYLELRTNGALATALGPAAIEVFVGAGELGDLSLIQPIARRTPASAELLDAIARFGHPATWAYLIHYLDHDELAEAARRALVTLFGALVPEAEQRRAAAWRDALTRADLAPNVRLRRGRPWSLEVVAEECGRDDFVRRDLDLRLDELRAHGVPAALDTALWGRPPAVSPRRAR